MVITTDQLTKMRVKLSEEAGGAIGAVPYTCSVGRATILLKHFAETWRATRSRGGLCVSEEDE